MAAPTPGRSRAVRSAEAGRGDLGGHRHATTSHVIVRHMVPSVLSALTVTATFAVAQAILLEAALSFLGLGVRPPQPSWGNRLNEAQSPTILESTC